MLTGGCLCGAIRYSYDGPSGPATYCHCSDCRRVTGSAFNVGVRLLRAQFRLVRGEVAAFTKAGDSGRPITRSFCAACGSPLFTTAPDRPADLWLKAGSLDAGHPVEPADQIWTDSRVGWSVPSDGLPAYSRGRPT
jgi:hypothetical protein